MAGKSAGACAASEARMLAALMRPGYAALAEGEARWMRKTQLLRARNRRADVREDCRRDGAATLDRLA